MIRHLCARGVSVILISHKLDEVLRCDRITVIRRGRVVATVDAGATTKEELAAMMVGRAVSLAEARPDTAPSRVPMLEVRGLTVKGRRGLALDAVSFTVHRGEILGIAAIAGNGQDELFEALVGVRPAEPGAEIILDGRLVSGLSPTAIAAEGVGYVPSDRWRDGLVAEFTVAENLLLGRQNEPTFRRGPFLRFDAVATAADASVAAFDIRTGTIDAPARTLSGGNAQKLILARELPLATKCLLCNQPVRGLDVGVIEYVRRQIIARRAAGCAVLLASEELEELLTLADRIMVLFRGGVMGIVDAAATDLQTLGLMMAGQRAESRAA
jgi:simple sugar transport system ATP-binding protein